MSIRLRKQINRQGVFDVKPKYGTRPHSAHIDHRDYAVVDPGGFGSTRSRMQQWRGVERKTDWYTKKGVVCPDTMLSPRHDRTSIFSRLSSSPLHLGTMASRVPRAPVELDSRRSHEKMTIASIQVAGTKNTPAALGPGAYTVTSNKDFGRSSHGVTWNVSKERSTDWWHLRSEAPSEFVDLTLFPSRTRVGGKDGVLWPLQEDENGRPITDDPYEYIRTISRGGSRIGSRVPSRSGSRAATPEPSKIAARTGLR